MLRSNEEIQAMIRLLEQTATTMGLTIQYEPILDDSELSSHPGGLCRLRDKQIIIINSNAPPKVCCETIARALVSRHPERFFVPPLVRVYLERFQ